MNLQKHQREAIRAMQRSAPAGVTLQGVEPGGKHARIVWQRPDGSIFKMSMASSPSDGRALSSILREFKRNF